MSDTTNEQFFTEDNIGKEENIENIVDNNQNADNEQIDASEQMNDDSDLFELKQRVKGMDEEAARLVQLQSEMEQQMKSTQSPTANFGSSPFPAAPMSAEEKMDADQRSIYVGNVDYSATAQELEAHFHGCGSINRVTILCDKFSGHPKGFAYVEFGDKDSVQTAQALDDSLFKGRQIKVSAKRSNRPGISTTDRVPRGAMRGGGGFMGAPRGRGGRGGGGGYGMGYGMAPQGFNPMRSARGRIVKPGGRGFYHYAPY